MGFEKAVRRPYLLLRHGRLADRTSPLSELPCVEGRVGTQDVHGGMRQAREAIPVALVRQRPHPIGLRKLLQASAHTPGSVPQSLQRLRPFRTRPLAIGGVRSRTESPCPWSGQPGRET